MTLGRLLIVVSTEQMVTLFIGDDKDEITARAGIIPDYLIDAVMDAVVNEIVVDDGKLKVWCGLDEDT